MGVGLAYVETRVSDIEPIKYQRLTDFVIKNNVRHIAIGLIDPTSQPGRIICGVSNHAVMVEHFIMRLPANVRLSAHPYDGFAHPKYPFRYQNLIGLQAVMRYVKDMNQLLTTLGSHVLFSGLVFGESMGGKPYKNDSATVHKFRNAMNHQGLSNFTLGASPGGPNLGLDESYFQCYDWTPYSSANPNPWITYRNEPELLLDAITHMNPGWNGENNQIPWSQTRNYFNSNQGLWKWQQPQVGAHNKHFMWALNVPEGDHKRLSAWSEQGIMKFFLRVGNQMLQGNTGFQTALYFDSGLEYFA